MKNKKQKPRKSVYQRPKLSRYGDVFDLTKTKAGTKADGGGKPKTKLSGTGA